MWCLADPTVTDSVETVTESDLVDNKGSFADRAARSLKSCASGNDSVIQSNLRGFPHLTHVMAMFTVGTSKVL